MREAAIVPVKAGVLTVEVSLPAPLWWNGDTIAQIQDGFEYCLAANVAWRLGLDGVRVVNADWDAMVTGQTKGFDVAISEISITPGRRKVADFSQPYYHSNIGVLVRKGRHMDAALIAEASIGVVQGTAGENYAETHWPAGTEMRVYGSESELFVALAAGQVKVALVDVSDALNVQIQSSGRLTVIAQYDTGEAYGALFPRGSANRDAIDRVIGGLVADGTTKRLQAEYLAPAWGRDPASIPLWQR